MLFWQMHQTHSYLGSGTLCYYLQYEEEANSLTTYLSILWLLLLYVRVSHNIL